MSDKKTIRDRVVDPGYRLPATIEPGEDVCIRVYVPKDSLYLAAFWAQYEKLGMWLSWERGGTRAKDAASAWKVRIAKARELNDCAGGDCGIMDVRQKPDYPCILQKWDDCESEWVDFADTRLCAPKMRITGTGVLQQWDGEQWVSVEPGEDEGGAYNPGHDLDNQIVNYDPPPSGQDGQCLSAINAVTYLSAAIDASMIELKELPYLVRLLDSILTTWYWRVVNFAAFTASMVTGNIWSLSWEDAHKLMSDKSLTKEDDIIAESIIADVLCYFKRAYEPDGTMTEASHLALMSEIQTAIDSETPNTPKAIKLEWLMLLSFPGPTWMANISNNAGIVDYDCDCPGWEHTFDFTISDYGWVPVVYSGIEAGYYQSGVGWWARWCGGDAFRYILFSPTASSSTVFDSVQFEWEFYNAEDDYANWYSGCFNNNTVIGWYTQQTGVYTPPPIDDRSAYGENTLTGNRIRVNGGNTKLQRGTHSNGEVGGAVLRRVRVTGQGLDPWA